MNPTLVYAEATPNPEVMKFVANRMIIEPMKQVEYLNVADTDGSPLAQELFKGGYVKSLFFTNNFVSITRTQNVDWSQIVSAVREFLQDYLTKDLPVIEVYPEPKVAENQGAAALQPDSPEEAITQILEEYIRPAVEQDGGAITFRSFENGVVTVALQGSCSGCPSSKVTLKAGIETMLKRMVPGVEEVVAEEI
jgi:NFU1 iron-sulfur cluster scaffold homolog, mitochondrial